MTASCIRTVNEEPCFDCKRITNAYDGMMGRLCPQCIARRGTQVGYNMRNPLEWSFDHHTVTEREIAADPVNTYLYTAPLIDHSDDIDKHIKRENNEKQR